MLALPHPLCYTCACMVLSLRRTPLMAFMASGSLGVSSGRKALPRSDHPLWWSLGEREEGSKNLCRQSLLVGPAALGRVVSLSNLITSGLLLMLVCVSTARAIRCPILHCWKAR